MSDTPQGILIIENYLTPDEVAAINDFCDFQVGKMALTGKKDSCSEDEDIALQRSPAFEAERIELHAIREMVESICKDIFGRVISDHYGVPIEWYEFPHILRYRKGGHYVPHSDSESWDAVQQCWVKGIDRDYSAVLYLNDRFTGGRLHFPDLDYYAVPKPGMLVCFPSGHKYRHAAEPTLSGKRYAMVTWASQKGVEKLLECPPMEVVYL